VENYYAESLNDYLDPGNFIRRVGTFVDYAIVFVLTALQDDVHHGRECWIHLVYPWWRVSWNIYWRWGDTLRERRMQIYIIPDFFDGFRFPKVEYLKIPSLWE
jgi:hypothetical protein